jgi:RHS repeat-associated protein
MSPTQGIVGTTVTLTGANFGTGGTAIFAGASITPSMWSNTSIEFNVSAGAESGEITLSTATGDTSSGIFTVLKENEGTTADVYGYALTYAPNGNVLTDADEVNGTWTYLYDNLNRLYSAVPGTGGASEYAGHSLCMYYDSFGNRIYSNLQTTGCVAPTGTLPTPTSTYSAGNRVGGYTYDAAGNVTYDGTTYYAYDNEGRLCATQTTNAANHETVAYAYLYDAEGRRVAKGTITSGSTPLSSSMCNPAADGFAVTESYVLGQAGEQLTTMTQGTTWARTNVYGAGAQLATYDLDALGTVALHFMLTDHLGTRRLQTDPAGTPEEACQSLPYGDGLSCVLAPNAPATADDANPLHYTGKERDTESGLDYFGARYYASSMGRWMWPDPINLTNARLMNPSNTLNKYAYAANNPLKYIDRDGQDITIYYRPPTGGATDFGHVLIGALNQDTGKTAFLDYYPGSGGTNAIGAGAGAFNLGDMSERGATNAAGGFASLTIQTNPEQAQKIINFIEKLQNGPAPDYSAFLGNNCTTICEDALHDLGLDFGVQSPSSFWQHAWANFSDAALNNPFKAFLSAPQATGHDYGRPRFSNQSQLMFQLYFNQMHPEQDHTSVTTTQGDGVPCGGSTGNPCK